MILIFDPYPPFLRWYKEEGGNYREGKCAFDLGWFDKVIKDVGDIKEIGSIGYCLHHGGDIIKEPAVTLNSAVLKKIEQCFEEEFALMHSRALSAAKTFDWSIVSQKWLFEIANALAE